MQVKEELSLCRIYKRSKCLRSFDRRPPTEAAAVGCHAAVHHHQHHSTEAITISNHQNQAVAHEKTNCTVDSSSSGDLAATDPSQSLEISENNWDMATDNEPLWDWEEFNWFEI